MSTSVTVSTSPESDALEAAAAQAAEVHAAEVRAEETHNLVALALHHVTLRVAWIFKTESVIMPAFMDAISGAGWMRGCLPFLNRFGQSVPPLFLAPRLRDARHKKWTLILTTALMSLPFLALSSVWFTTADKRAAWLPPLFLILYVLFFSFTGLNQLAFGTIQGKLIRPERRGRLMALAGICGSVLAITSAWFLLRQWLQLPDSGYGAIFLFTGSGFLVSGLIGFAVREPADPEHHSSAARLPHPFQLMREDHTFRKLVIVAALFVTAQWLFPHYQALGRTTAAWDPLQLMVWVIAQNAGAGVFSLLAGAVADRWGNRLALKLEILGAGLTPFAALLLARTESLQPFYGLTFFLLGTVPTTFKTLVNYLLEATPSTGHPQYISSLKVCMAVPFIVSPVIGALIEWIGFEFMFSAVALSTLAGALFALRLPEPRHELTA